MKTLMATVVLCTAMALPAFAESAGVDNMANPSDHQQLNAAGKKATAPAATKPETLNQKQEREQKMGEDHDRGTSGSGSSGSGSGGSSGSGSGSGGAGGGSGSGGAGGGSGGSGQ
jgi:hypothetical protein